MIDPLLDTLTAPATTLIPVSAAELDTWRAQQSPIWQAWLNTACFQAKPGQFCLLPDIHGALTTIAVGFDPKDTPWQLASLPQTLPSGVYSLHSDWDRPCREAAALGWALGAYQFTSYKTDTAITTAAPPARLFVGADADLDAVRALVAATTFTRDLINTPAQDLLPEHLAEITQDLARQHGAVFHQWIGEELLQNRYPLIHAVGRASASPPRLLELLWGEPDQPLLTLVGKGVCFDTGGLDLKPSSGMRLMKKDMGGAAQALGLAQWIMRRGLPLRLRVLIPAVENAVAGNAFRPGDVLYSRQGLSVEIDNTDAEGRLILADALTAAVEQSPALLVDFATLTGAARVAVGTEIAACFSHDDALAAGLMQAAQQVNDPIWRLPLHRPYRDLLESKVADLANASSSGYAGAITAALFLQAFVPPNIAWAHFDMMGWNTRARPGRPEGGEAMGLRAVAAYLEQRFQTPVSNRVVSER